MKRKMKKMVALLLSVIMVMVTGATVFAAEEPATPTEATLTIHTDSTTPTGHEKSTYTAYQVMTAITVGVDKDGNPIYQYTVNKEFKGFFDGTHGYTLNERNQILKKGAEGAEDVIVVSDGTSANTSTTEAASLAAALEKYAKAQGIEGTDVINEAEDAKVKSLPIGYYVVAETLSGTGDDSIVGSDKVSITKVVASKPILVNLIADVTISPKDSTIRLEKGIVKDGGSGKPTEPTEPEKADNTVKVEETVKKNNVNIGDIVNYQVVTNIPTYEANVDQSKLSYVLTDTFSKGLDYQNDVIVAIGADENGLATMTEGKDYTLKFDTNTRQLVITLSQDTIYNHQGESVVLKYSAKLNENAVVDSPDGNPNDIDLAYTNNPNVDESSDTLHDKTITYTYGFKIHKVDMHNEYADMAGAEFSISNEAGVELGRFTYGDDGSITTTGNIKITLEENKPGEAMNYAVLSGLDAGKYTIKEEAAPKDYALLGSDVTVTIEDQGEATNGVPTGIATIKVEGQGTAESDLVDNGDGSIDLVVKIVNAKGISLPETGAKTALYCLFGGAILVILGGLYFGITKLVSCRKQ